MTRSSGCRPARPCAVSLTRPAAIVIALTLGIVSAACGGSSSTSSAPHQQTAAHSSTSTPAQSAASSGAAVSSGPVRATLTAKNHAPKVGQRWHYSVTVMDATGHPLAGTVDIEFAFGGQVVGHDTPPTHPVRNGRWQDNLKFPGAAIGQPLTLLAVVHTRLGSITLNWPVTAHQ